MQTKEERSLAIPVAAWVSGRSITLDTSSEAARDLCFWILASCGSSVRAAISGSKVTITFIPSE